MTRATQSRFGVLGILLIGVVVGYVVARTSTLPLSSAEAKEADKQKENRADKEPTPRGAKADANPSPKRWWISWT